jgi:hypothetical protein
VGSTWNGFSFNDYGTVIKNCPIAVPVGSFSPGFQIRRSWRVENDLGEVVTWIVPQIGIVELSRREYGWFFAKLT